VAIARLPNPRSEASGAAFSLRRYTMSDGLKRAQRYRHLAKECWRLATVEVSTDIRKHYLEMADHFSTLADAEELTTLRHENGD